MYKVIKVIYIVIGKVSSMLVPMGHPLDGVDTHPSLHRTEGFFFYWTQGFDTFSSNIFSRN